MGSAPMLAIFGVVSSSRPCSRSFASLPGRTSISLANLSPAPGSNKKRKRKGRGIAAHGHLCGRGANGQNSRSGGGPPPGFEGGQTPFYLRMPKKGFHNPAAKSYTEVNVDRIQHLIDTGRLDPSKPITLKSFVDAGIGVSLDGLKVLGGGKAHLRQPIELHATRFTKGAIQAIEAVGGRALAVYHSQEAIRQLHNPARFAKKHPELAPLPFEAPTGIRERLFYSSEKARGYLAPGMTLSDEFRKVYQLPNSC